MPEWCYVFFQRSLTLRGSKAIAHLKWKIWCLPLKNLKFFRPSATVKDLNVSTLIFSLRSEGTAISFCPFKGRLHLLYSGQGRIIVDLVYLSETFESILNLNDTFQPFQGCFAHIISENVKGDLADLLCLGMDCINSSKDKKKRQCDDPWVLFSVTI